MLAPADGGALVLSGKGGRLGGGLRLTRALGRNLNAHPTWVEENLTEAFFDPPEPVGIQAVLLFLSIARGEAQY